MKLLLLGDVCPTDPNRDRFINGDVEALFGDTLSLFDAADFSVVNLECAITTAVRGIKKFGPCLKAPIETAQTLKRAGVDCCGMSNNHIFDFGRAGIQSTREALAAAGIAHTGFGDNAEDARRNLYIEKDGQKVALIAVCEHEYSYALPDRMGARAYDPYDTMEDIRAAAAVCDRVVVMYHGGKEHCKYPSPRVRRLCRAMVKNGADVVLCQHSHCIATYEQFEGGHILHGQGNFLFIGQGRPDGWYSSLAVTYDTESGEITFTPVACGEVGVHLAQGEEKTAILSAFEKRNAELASGEWQKGWHEFCLEKSGMYLDCVKKAMADEAGDNDNHFFAHYLDCEAHTDVWRELFPTYNHTNERE